MRVEDRKTKQENFIFCDKKRVKEDFLKHYERVILLLNVRVFINRVTDEELFLKNKKDIKKPIHGQNLNKEIFIMRKLKN